MRAGKVIATAVLAGAALLSSQSIMPKQPKSRYHKLWNTPL